MEIAKTKLDRRVRYTKNAIRDSFFSLMKEKPADKITVKEICERADINRGTFYTHYTDAPALVAELEEEFAAKLLSILEKMYVSDDYLDVVITEMLETFKANPMMGCLMLDEHSTGKGLKFLQEASRQKLISSWKLRGDLSDFQAELVYTYVTSGCMEVFRRWYSNGCTADKAEVKSVLEQVITGGLFAFVREL
jgi:AcrR family transcriptional regulator